jgi:hypothetical protein
LELKGVLLGLTAHFWRDLGETGSSAFLASVAVVTAVALWRASAPLTRCRR